MSPTFAGALETVLRGRMELRTQPEESLPRKLACTVPHGDHVCPMPGAH